jgi:hypothetical protein
MSPCSGSTGTYFQVYSDERGVCRINEMSISNGECPARPRVWTSDGQRSKRSGEKERVVETTGQGTVSWIRQVKRLGEIKLIGNPLVGVRVQPVPFLKPQVKAHAANRPFRSRLVHVRFRVLF